jgi:hypothetical protein
MLGPDQWWELAKYRRSPEQGPEVRLAPLREYARNGDQDYSVYRVDFRKWARGWYVMLVCRDPIEEEALAQGLGMLRSLEFPNAPVATDDQAIEAALAVLPDEFRMRMNAFDACKANEGYDYQASSRWGENGYTILFTSVEPARVRKP